jgi:ABC-type cobalamin/Fe3+-siderophores transport system ATPase subunit
LDGASLTLSKGDRVAIIGPNGVGKSTLLRLIMGIEKPQGGRVIVQNSNAVRPYRHIFGTRHAAEPPTW